MRNRRSLLHVRRLLAEERGNCFLYGCVTLVVLCLLGGLIVFLSLRYMMQQVREKYTAETPIALPTVDMPQADIDALIARVDEYAKDLREEKSLEPITLTQDEINVLLQNHPDLKETYGDHMYVTLGDNQVTAQMSLPLDWLPLFRDRYFNGVATFDVGFMNGRLQIYLDSATVKGEPVPAEQIRQMRGENLGKQLNDDSDARDLMRRIDTIAITKDNVTITPTTGTAEEGTPPTEDVPSEAAPAEEAAPEAA